MKYLKFFFLITLIINSISVYSQSKYFKKNLQTLSSSKMEGRGYVNDGMKKASKFLDKEFKRNGLKSFNNTYFQKVTFPINIIQDAKLNLNGKSLIYGKDFIVKPNTKHTSFSNNQIYNFPVEEFLSSGNSNIDFKRFIENEIDVQLNKNIVLPHLNSNIDSINKVYKNWGSKFKDKNFKDVVIFRFTNDSLTSSLSQTQSNVSEFIIKSKYYSKDLKIEDYAIKTKFDSDFEFNNVIGYLDGENNDSVIVITAHYDHLGRVGNAIFPGASDNASGTAMALDLMKHYAKNKPKYKTVFMFFGAEEAGIVGAYKYVENPLFPLNQIKFLVNLDLMANGGEGIQVVNGTKYSKEFNQIVQINKETKLLKDIKIRGESCNSDHCPFDKKGVPSFFIYTLGGNSHYHNVYDTYRNLDLKYSDNVKELIIKFIDQL